MATRDEFDMVDVVGKHVELVIDDRGTVWVNIDNVCAIRAQECASIIVDDKRPKVARSVKDAVRKLGPGACRLCGQATFGPVCRFCKDGGRAT